MKNIERKYAYHDDGVFPAEGEEGTTYLTLYSSNGGNTYDGWIWDPDRVHYSETERTFGYRYPQNEDYCWDDEVIVDLSNAQTREETSEYATGRMVSFNTNVSDQPILLQDVDITGMTEAEREAAATTILFTAIPLTKSAYIHAQIEVQMKMNLSPDNTTGNIRVEAFYILNDMSDRTMRPHPINHYSVTRANEYNILPLMYYNPALNHEDHNYIGVKLLVTGGTAEIGISDNPQYGDAIITVVSNGMTGDTIESSTPVSIELTGLDEVVPGYELDESDYTVLCTYSGGEVYDVTRLCTFNPPMGTMIVDQLTTLTASFQGLSDSMQIAMSEVEYIELIGLADIYGSYNLSKDDYTVFAYFDNGELLDVTDECEFSPAVGTPITQNTTLTATYAPFGSQGDTYTDSMSLTKHGVRNKTGSTLVYTLYDDYHADITGHVASYTLLAEPSVNFRIADSASLQGYNGSFNDVYTNSYPQSGFVSYADPGRHGSTITLSGWSIRVNEGSTGTIGGPNNQVGLMFPAFFRSAVSIEWKATGKPLVIESNINSNSQESLKGLPALTQLINFENIDVSEVRDLDNFLYNSKLTNIEFMRSWTNTSNLLTLHQTFYSSSLINDFSPITDMNLSNVAGMTWTFCNCTQLTNLSFLSNISSNFTPKYLKHTFMGCTNLVNTRGIENINTSLLEEATGLFYDCTSLVNIADLANLDMSNVKCFNHTFRNCSSLDDIDELSSWDTSSVLTFAWMFAGCVSLSDISGASGWDVSSAESLSSMFLYCVNLNEVDLNSWDTSSVKGMIGTFSGCHLTGGISIGNWDTQSLEIVNGLLCGTIYGYNGAASISSLTNGRCETSYELWNDIKGLDDWDVSNLKSDLLLFGFDGGTYNVNDGTFIHYCLDLEATYRLDPYQTLGDFLISKGLSDLYQKMLPWSRIINTYKDNYVTGVDPEYIPTTSLNGHYLTISAPENSIHSTNFGEYYRGKKKIGDKVYLNGYRMTEDSGTYIYTPMWESDAGSGVWESFISSMKAEYQRSPYSFPSWYMNTTDRTLVRSRDWNQGNETYEEYLKNT